MLYAFLARLNWSALEQVAAQVEDGQCAALQSGADDAAVFKSQSLFYCRFYGLKLTDAVDDVLCLLGGHDGYLVEVGCCACAVKPSANRRPSVSFFREECFMLTVILCCFVFFYSGTTNSTTAGSLRSV